MNNIQKIIDNEFSNTTGIIVKKDNSIIYESYFNEATKDSPLHIYSITKSIVSICLGIAIDKGYIESVDDKIMNYFPDDTISKEKSFIYDISIKDLLTMKIHFKNDEDSYRHYFTSDNWTRFALDNIIEHSEGFIYSPLIGLDILSEIIKQTSSKSLFDFAKDFLFDPLNIKVEGSLKLNSEVDYANFNNSNKISGWAIDSSDNNSVGWGLSLSTSDLIKIGDLILNDGIYNEQVVVSKRWLNEMLKISNKWQEMNLNYGYLWWILDEHTYAALGDGGNTLLIDKQKNIVVSITGYYNGKKEDRLHFIFETLLPSLNI